MAKTEIKFTKQKLIQSSQFSQIEKDILTAILSDGEYTIKACFEEIKKFKESKVSE
ncbi:hypothetical protein HNQ80_004834 [Anaerosolibacter carboniphilus]|uniref:Uncharacterized protein n=1 Tax=Anaerosolibacter carboniphilus TaxID=1417629 RepID=A0A841L3B3_9FIRM|nr:hypothetical protein [Anaerosolibacter carboniphilus]MBB6218660.1 hypothetical protein [Anaerosolibacter carboniphilus]